MKPTLETPKDEVIITKDTKFHIEYHNITPEELLDYNESTKREL